MPDPAKSPGFAKNPDYHLAVERSPRRVRVEFNGEIIADSTRMRLVHEGRHLPVYYFPLEDVRLDLMTPTETSTHCPYKGHASYWSVTVGDKTAEDVLWSYPDPYDEMPEFKGLGAFYWGKVDHWYEEDEEIFVHARDPYKRIDTVPSSREVVVRIGGEEVARSTRAHFLFETNLPVRYYIPREDVRMDVLTATETTSRCPYKGIASYWSASIGGETYDDIAWSYPDPIPECPKIKDLMCFYNERVDPILTDGVEQPIPETKWSKK